MLAEVAKTAATPVRGENTSDAAFPWLRDFTDEEDEALQVSANAIEVEGETFVIVSRSYTTSDRECGPSYDPSTVCMWWSEIVVVHDLDGSPTEVGHLQHSFGGVDASPPFVGRGMRVDDELRIEESGGYSTERWFRLGP